MSGIPNWCLTGSGALIQRDTRQVERPTIAAQHLIRQVIDSGAATFGVYHDHTTAAVGALADIRAVAGRILASATAEDWRRVLPADLDAAYAAAQRRSRASAVNHEPKPGRAAPAHAV